MPGTDTRQRSTLRETCALARLRGLWYILRTPVLLAFLPLSLISVAQYHCQYTSCSLCNFLFVWTYLRQAEKRQPHDEIVDAERCAGLLLFVMVVHDGIDNGVGRGIERRGVITPRPFESSSPQNGRGKECSPQQTSNQSKADDSFTSLSDVPPTHDSSGVAFWNVNIPPSEWKDECPEYLRYAFKDDKDRAVLATPDAEYQRQSWDQVRGLIRGNRLDLFKRVPSQLRLYRAYCQELIREFGSIMNFVLKERLHWEDLKFSAGPPFTNAGMLARSHSHQRV